MLSILKMSVTGLFISTLPALAYALPPNEVFDKVKNSVVIVKTVDIQGNIISQGSGVVIRSNLIATNCHVVKGGASYQVNQGQNLIPAHIFSEDIDKDICLLSVNSILGKPAQFGSTIELKVGTLVYAVGAPRGLEFSLSNGIVAQLRGGSPPLIQTTAAISPGSSGGGLFDEEGRLVGLTTLNVTGGQSLNFAMPVEFIKEMKLEHKQSAVENGQIERLKKAIALENIEDWTGALDWCKEWVKLAPKNAEAWFGIGNAYQGLKRYDEAITPYRQALLINSDFEKAWFNLGIAYTNVGNNNDAIAAFGQALLLTPDNDETSWCLGIAYQNLQHYSDAIDSFRKSLLINPNFDLAWFNLGYSYSKLKRYEEAIEAYQQALRINPDFANAWRNLGIACSLNGDKITAIRAVKELRRLDPEQADSLLEVLIPR